MELLTAALGKSAAPKKKAPAKKAAPATAEINGIELYDDSEPPTVAPKPKKKVAAPREVEAPLAPAPKKARAPKVSGGAEAAQVGGAPAPAPKAKRMPVKAMPHSCTCPMCPLKE